ncbi:MAG: hypothetical protein ACK47B_03910 [Armatimonadota bacterium]
MNPFSKMSRRSLLLAGMAVSLVALSGAEARKAPSLDNLKGTYNGTFQQTEGGGSASGKLIVKIISDKTRQGSRMIKATARFGRKTYKLQGGYEPSIKQLNLGGVSGRPPKITQIAIMGHFQDEQGGVFNGLYSISSFNGANNGECTLNRKGVHVH